MSVVAKFKVSHVDAFEYGSTVHLNAVHAPPGSDERVTSKEDGSFWDATPNGKCEMTVNNPLAAEQFTPGDEFYLTFERAPKPGA